VPGGLVPQAHKNPPPKKRGVFIGNSRNLENKYLNIYNALSRIYNFSCMDGFSSKR